MVDISRERAEESPPKKTRFVLRGRVVDPKDIARFEKRLLTKGKAVYDGKGGTEQEPIEDLAYDTPSEGEGYPYPEPFGLHTSAASGSRSEHTYSQHNKPRASDTFSKSAPSDATSYTQLPDETQGDLKIEKVHGFGLCWTFPCLGVASEEEMPLNLDGIPVVIPVRSRYPLMSLASPPPDPFPHKISPIQDVPEEDAVKILGLFSEAIGFYILINGSIQVIMPDDFDFEEGLSRLPCEVGGLKVSFIRQSVYPTAGFEASSSIDSSDASMSDLGTSPLLNQPNEASVIKTGGANVTARFKCESRSSIGVFMAGRRSTGFHEGKFGVLVQLRYAGGQTFATVPTHLLTAAMSDSKTGIIEPQDWTPMVRVQIRACNLELGAVARSIPHRVRDDAGVRAGQSGTPVCVVDSSDETGGTPVAKVAGFASFVQMVSDVQRFDLEGDKLYKRLQEGRVAFYGAFRLPSELTDEYTIV
ncbi:hypothetical protein OQA88_8015 [Cercophora sp. LCS_1]